MYRNTSIRIRFPFTASGSNGRCESCLQAACYSMESDRKWMWLENIKMEDSLATYCWRESFMKKHLICDRMEQFREIL
jgi:hypothetical protein